MSRAEVTGVSMRVRTPSEGREQISDPQGVVVLWQRDETGPVFTVLDEATKAEVVVLKSGFSTQCESEVCVAILANHCEYLLDFANKGDAALVSTLLRSHTLASQFDLDRDTASSKEYFSYYARISQQQNMLADLVRTGTYQRAMHANSIDFKDKVVCDVGCGTGVLSMFAAQAGARMVYAIEASDMAERAKAIIKHNRLDDRIHVLKGRCEEVELPEQVDIIVSEPMGVMLLNERMLESYIYARKWLKPGGLMFPTVSNMFASLFSDETYYLETCSKANFFTYPQFFGIDMRCLYNEAMDEYFNQPAVEQVDPACLVGDTHKHVINFLEIDQQGLQDVTMAYKTVVPKTTIIHGVASWFDVVFMGSKEHVVLDTGPHSPLTHWYQVRCLLRTPVLVTEGQTVSVRVECKANRLQSFFVDVSVHVDGTALESHGRVHLKEPNFRFSGFVPPAAPARDAAMDQ